MAHPHAAVLPNKDSRGRDLLTTTIGDAGALTKNRSLFIQSGIAGLGAEFVRCLGFRGSSNLMGSEI